MATPFTAHQAAQLAAQLRSVNLDAFRMLSELLKDQDPLIQRYAHILYFSYDDIAQQLDYLPKAAEAAMPAWPEAAQDATEHFEVLMQRLRWRRTGHQAAG